MSSGPEGQKTANCSKVTAIYVKKASLCTTVHTLAYIDRRRLEPILRAPSPLHPAFFSGKHGDGIGHFPLIDQLEINMQ